MSGFHLLIDGKASRPPDYVSLRRFVDACVALDGPLGLHLIGGPFFFELEHARQMFAIIAESHISVEAFHNGEVLIDVFSCKLFSAHEVIRLAHNELGLEQWTSQVIQRAGTGV